MRPIRWIACAAAFVALTIASAWLLYQYAQWQVTAYLRDQAAHALVLAARAETPYQWRFDDSDSVVAGRVFNARSFAFRDGELVVQSSGDVFELGLPLARPVDLQLFPHLQIVAEADGAAAIRAVSHETLESSGHVVAESALVPGSEAALNLAAAMPAKVAMLRLRVAAPPGTTVRLRSATLARAQGAPRLDLDQQPRVVDFGEPRPGNPIYRLPLHEDLLEADVEAMAKRADASSQPLILLPQHARIEQQIALRNAVYTALPGAILIPERAIDATFAQAREEVARTSPERPSMLSLRWSLFAIYVVALAWSRARPAPAPRWRALTEALLAQAGPLWLILGERFDGKPDSLQWLLIIVSMAYAISLSVPRHWRWNGSARTWLPALGVIAFALLLGLALRQSEFSPHPLGSGHIVRYVGWAFFQQYLVCAVCTERWRIVTGNSAAAAYLGALGFALMHTPNAALMLATLCGGLCWCGLYLRERALLPLAVSHAASALLLLALLPRSLLASAEVSARFFQ